MHDILQFLGNPYGKFIWKCKRLFSAKLLLEKWTGDDLIFGC